MTEIAPWALSLNGVDNVGKTTQLRWLARAVPSAHLVGSIDSWDSRWRDVAAGDFAHWWFVSSTTTEHVSLVMESHVARRAASRPFAFEDRGLPMLRATCAATAAVKHRLTPKDALDRVDELMAGMPVPDERREVHVLLRRFDDPAREAAAALGREAGLVDDRYATYQRMLAEILRLQALRGDYHEVLDLGDAPILDVQRQLRSRMSPAGVDVDPLRENPVDRLWVLGGLSESGKSTVGALLRDEHGVTRLKIGYLLEVAALRASVADPYADWSESEQAEHLTEEILRFAQSAKATTISVESAHRFEATRHLKRVWGDRSRVVYVHADDTVRTSRTTEAPAQLRDRDGIKRIRGADRVADIADHVIDNSGPLGALKLAVHRLVTAADVPGAAAFPCVPETQRAWLGQATDHVLDNEVALVLATGSTGTANWRSGWSDLDLLVVRDTAPASWLREVVNTLPSPDGVKTAVSVFTTADLDALRVPPRVVQSLRRAGRGIGILYRRDGYRLPIPSTAHGDRTSRSELGLVLMTTRRLLADDSPDVRALHKHLVLLAKLLLRADGHDLSDAEQVLAAFNDIHPEAGCDPPGLDHLIRTSSDPAMRQRVVDTTDRLLTYLDQLDDIVRTKQ